LWALWNPDETVHWRSEEVHDLHATAAQSTDIVHYKSTVGNVIAPYAFISSSADTAPVDRNATVCDTVAASTSICSATFSANVHH
jgi:hypothetical protein